MSERGFTEGESAVNGSVGQGSVDAGEVMSLCVIGLVVGGTVTSGALGWLNGAVRWLVAHGVLVDGRHSLWAIPGAGGAGLDWPRLLLVAGVVVLLLVWLGSAAVRMLRRRQVEES